MSWLIGNDKSISPFLAVQFLPLLGRAAPSDLSWGSPHRTTPCSRQSSSNLRSFSGSLNRHLPKAPISANPQHPLNSCSHHKICVGEEKSHTGMPQHRPTNPPRPTQQHHQAGGSTSQEKKVKVAETAIIPNSQDSGGWFLSVTSCPRQGDKQSVPWVGTGQPSART